MAAPNPRSLRFEVEAVTTASPEQVIEIAGKDFSPRRAEIWPNVRASRLVVNDRGEGFVEATEGGTGPARFVWERSRYEWPQPGGVRATVIDSNAFLPGTTFELRASAREGGSRVEMILDRRFRPTGWGRVGYALNRVFGARGFSFMLRQMLKAVEKRLAASGD
jgi:hypothetical protein